jgi:hypothetical protein
MGNRERGTIFHQSLGDFPCPVVLGKNTPSFGLHRYKQGLRFIPPDDEGFTLRGDKRRLLYKGRRRSHRFTILGDTSFEYDCILEREPESNVVSLLMHGAENFDFFLQPDFVKNPFLKGSYAVYKKNSLIGEGTGKLCHIHRPLIIDARGRRCWGTLAVAGNVLRITIPEKWLSEAKYPVIVDPVVGTTTVGSESWVENDVFSDCVCLYGDVSVNRFYAPETINGTCTAFAYVWDQNSDDIGYGLIYSDNGNKPLNKISQNEEEIALVHPRGKEVWVSGEFELKTAIPAGSYIWFGIMADYWAPFFDYGSLCYYTYNKYLNYPPETFPTPHYSYDMKLSMYFTYNSSNSFTRRIYSSQNKLRISDSNNTSVEHKRMIPETIYNFMAVGRFPVFVRTCNEFIHLTTYIHQLRLIAINCIDSINAFTKTQRFHHAARIVQDFSCGIDNQSFSVLLLRTVTDYAVISHYKRHWGAFIRGLSVNAGTIAETSHKAEYHRFQADTVQAAGAVFRGLLLFVRIVSRIFVRDYILGRFLKAREELVLKSVICREIELESKI